MSDCGEEKAAIEEEDGIPTNQPPSRKETRLRERACLLSESYSDVIIRARADGGSTADPGGPGAHYLGSAIRRPLQFPGNAKEGDLTSA